MDEITNFSVDAIRQNPAAFIDVVVEEALGRGNEERLDEQLAAAVKGKINETVSISDAKQLNTLWVQINAIRLAALKQWRVAETNRMNLEKQSMTGPVSEEEVESLNRQVRDSEWHGTIAGNLQHNIALTLEELSNTSVHKDTNDCIQAMMEVASLAEQNFSPSFQLIPYCAFHPEIVDMALAASAAGYSPEVILQKAKQQIELIKNMINQPIADFDVSLLTDPPKFAAAMVSAIERSLSIMMPDDNRGMDVSGLPLETRLQNFIRCIAANTAGLPAGSVTNLFRINHIPTAMKAKLSRHFETLTPKIILDTHRILTNQLRDNRSVNTIDLVPMVKARGVLEDLTLENLDEARRRWPMFNKRRSSSQNAQEYLASIMKFDPNATPAFETMMQQIVDGQSPRPPESGEERGR
jgi:hypothetical protein